MTVEERLREAVITLRAFGPRPIVHGRYVDELMEDAADELRATYRMAGELATALRDREEG